MWFLVGLLTRANICKPQFRALFSSWRERCSLYINLYLIEFLNVYDSQATSFEKLQKWVEAADILNYEVLMCVGNKADRLPTHFGHTEYRRRLQERGESFSDPHPNFLDFGIDRTEGSGLLSDGDLCRGTWTKAAFLHRMVYRTWHWVHWSLCN